MKIDKILFVRLSDPKLSNKHPRNLLPPIQFGYMIKLVEKEYEIKFIDCRVKNLNVEELVEKTVKFKPDVVVAMFMTYDHKFSMNYFSELKTKSKTIIVCIGQQSSFAPKHIIFEKSPVDFLLIGESELEFVELIKKLENNEDTSEIKGLYSLSKKEVPKPTLIESLDDLPIPKHEMFNPNIYRSAYPLQINKNVKWGYILATRGCPYDCIFCSPAIRESHGRGFRTKSVSKIVDEMEYLKSLGVNVISFLDDCPTISKKFIGDLCDEIVRRNLNINWISHARIDHLTKDLMIKMKEAGCILVKVGVESGSNRIINIVKKSFLKIDWNATARQFFKNSKEVGLPVCGMFILGSPTETKKDVEKTIELIKETDPDILQIAYFTPYPGTEAYSMFYNSNDGFDENFYHYNPAFVNYSNISARELKRLQRRIYQSFYLRPKFILNHLRKYAGFYLRNPNVLRNMLVLT